MPWDQNSRYHLHELNKIFSARIFRNIVILFQKTAWYQILKVPGKYCLFHWNQILDITFAATHSF